jgi:hypothetical protein
MVLRLTAIVLSITLSSCSPYQISTTGFPIVEIDRPSGEFSEEYLDKITSCQNSEAWRKGYDGPNLDVQVPHITQIYLKNITRQELEAFRHLVFLDGVRALSDDLQASNGRYVQESGPSAVGLLSPYRRGFYKIVEYQTRHSTNTRMIAQLSLVQIGTGGVIENWYSINYAGDIRRELAQSLMRIKQCVEI